MFPVSFYLESVTLFRHSYVLTTSVFEGIFLGPCICSALRTMKFFLHGSIWKKGNVKIAKMSVKKNANRNSNISKTALHSSVINIHVSDKLQKTFPWKKQHPGDDGYFIRLSDRSEEVISCGWFLSMVMCGSQHFLPACIILVSGTNAWKQYKYYTNMCIFTCQYISVYLSNLELTVHILHTSIYRSIIQGWLGSNGLKVLKYLKHMVKNILQQ